MRVREMVNDGSVQVWTPPDGKPVVFDADRPLEDVVEPILRAMTAASQQPAAPPATPAGTSTTRP